MGLPIFVSPRGSVTSNLANHGSQRDHPHLQTDRPYTRLDGGVREVMPPRAPLLLPGTLRFVEPRGGERPDGSQATATRRTQSFLRWRNERNRGNDEVRREIRRTLLEATATHHVEETPRGTRINFPSLAGKDIGELREMLQTWRGQLFGAADISPEGLAIGEVLEAYRRYVLRIEERISLLREQLDEGDGTVSPEAFRLIPQSAGQDDLAAARDNLERSRAALSALRRVIAGAEGAPSAVYLDVVSTISMDHATRLHFDWLRRRLVTIRDEQYIREHTEATGSNSARN